MHVPVVVPHPLYVGGLRETVNLLRRWIISQQNLGLFSDFGLVNEGFVILGNICELGKKRKFRLSGC